LPLTTSALCNIIARGESQFGWQAQQFERMCVVTSACGSICSFSPEILRRLALGKVYYCFQAFHQGSMPVTWEFRDSVLVVRLVGKYDFEEPIQAVNDAMSSPQFRAGTSLIVDARRSEARRSSEELRARAHWMASLVPQGMSPRFAIVISSKPHHYGLARLASIHLDLQNMTLEIFADFEEAMHRLKVKASPAGGK
jgi:hypothetical protein